MEWHELLQQAESAEASAREQLQRAEAMYARAIETAQTTLGPYDVNLARCLLTFGRFLEQQGRFSDAMLRYKLAATIYRQGKHPAAHSLAKSNVERMEQILGINQPNPGP